MSTKDKDDDDDDNLLATPPPSPATFHVLCSADVPKRVVGAGIVAMQAEGHARLFSVVSNCWLLRLWWRGGVRHVERGRALWPECKN